VAGVCADTLEAGFSVSPSPEIYVPEWFSNDFAIRVTGDPMALAVAVRERIRTVEPSLAVHDIAPMTARIEDSLQDRRVLARLLSVIAALALALAAIGIYGVIAHATTRRIQEVGLRMALGARPGSIAGLILRQGMAAVAAGILTGAAGGYAITRLLSSQLFNVRAGDPAAFAGIALLMTMVGLFACWFPVRRAMRVDPAITLRYQ
jgi:predicted lysophospholipase L1 biosynthesis ABC-type transport system permease subunit